MLQSVFLNEFPTSGILDGAVFFNSFKNNYLNTVLAERVGFEPTVRLSTYTRFPGVRLKPLIHLSGNADFNRLGRTAGLPICKAGRVPVLLKTKGMLPHSDKIIA